MRVRFNPLQPDPEALPPAQVRFKNIRVEPWPEGNKIRVLMELTPFQVPPNLEVIITDTQGQEITSTHIIENVDYRLVITLHLRRPAESLHYYLTARLIYPDLGNVDEQNLPFELPLSPQM
ncbi:MAG: hypothetical protein N3A60_10505 [Thermanaerothrix sp.]|nr:hypothetical protein [Thermanaerothrix sp.]